MNRLLLMAFACLIATPAHAGDYKDLNQATVAELRQAALADAKTSWSEHKSLPGSHGKFNPFDISNEKLTASLTLSALHHLKGEEANLYRSIFESAYGAAVDLTEKQNVYDLAFSKDK
jgi:hypothetical protein